MRLGSVLLADSHSPMLEGIRSLLDERFEIVVMVPDVRSLIFTSSYGGTKRDRDAPRSISRD